MTKKRRSGRGRLSSIDLLPPQAAPDIEWAVSELMGTARPQTEILKEFNGRLAVHGLDPVSSSSFSRHSLRLAASARRMKETQDITDAIAARLGPDKTDNLTVGVVRMLKQAAWEIVESGGIDAKSVLSLSKSVQALVGAQKTSADLRRTSEAEIDARLKKVADAVQTAGREHGFSADTVEKIKSQILGVTT